MLGQYLFTLKLFKLDYIIDYIFSNHVVQTIIMVLNYYYLTNIYFFYVFSKMLLNYNYKKIDSPRSYFLSLKTYKSVLVLQLIKIKLYKGKKIFLDLNQLFLVTDPVN